MSTHSRPVAFIDRDGTIVRDYPDEQWASVMHPEFIPGALDGLQCLTQLGFGIVVVTNQYTIGERIITPLAYLEFSGQVVSHLRQARVALVDFLHCPHARDVLCSCRKPATGMGIDALARHSSLMLEGGIMVGDSDSDMEFADALGLRGFLLANDSTPKEMNLRRFPSWEVIISSIEAGSAP